MKTMLTIFILSLALLPAEMVAADCDSSTVTLIDYGGSKLNVIKAVKAITGLGLREAKELVDDAPSTIVEDVSSAEAEAVAAQLEAAGATVEVECEG